MENFSEKTEIFKIYNNIKEFIQIRDYSTSYKFDITKNNIIIDNLIQIDTINKKNNLNIIILFIVNSDANVIKKSDVFLKYINNLDKKKTNLDKIIIISKFKLSNNLNKKIKLFKKNMVIENILFKVLIFNPIKHINYQNYSFALLPEDEKNNLFNLIDYNHNSINKIFIDDPICIYYDFQVNDIIKIIKPTIKTAGFTCTYRRVVNNHIGNNRNIINKQQQLIDVDILEEQEQEHEHDDDDGDKIKIKDEDEEEEEEEEEEEVEDFDDIDIEQIEDNV